MGKTSLPLLLIVLILAGCATSSANRLWLNRDYQGLSQISSEEFTRLSVMDLKFVCEGKLKVQKYAEFDQCISILKERLKTERSGNIAITFSHESSMAAVSSMEATKYLELGQYDKAIDVALVGQKLYTDSVAGREGMYKNNVDMGTVGLFSVPAISYAMLGDRKSAELHLGKSLDRYSGMNKGFGFTAMHKQEEYWIATSMFVLKDYKRAYEFLLTDRANAGESFYNAIYSAHSMADASALYKAVMLNRLALENGDIEKARKGFDAMLSNGLVKQLSEIHFRVLQDRARLAIKDGDMKLAEELLTAGVELLEGARASIQTESYKLGFAGGRFSIYEDMVGLLVDQGRHDEALGFAERGKSRALVDMLASKQSFATRDAKSADQQKQLLAELGSNESTATEPIGADRKTVTRNLVRQNREKLTQQAPELSSLVTVGAVSIKELQSLLPESETLVEYFGSERNLFAFVVDKQNVKGVRLDSANLHDDVVAFRKWISPGAGEERGSRNLKRQQTNINVAPATSSKLYARVFKPLESLIRTQNITIIPHDALHYLPFAALDTGKGHLIDKYAVHTLPSASTMKYLNKSSAAKTIPALVFGNPDLGDAKMDLPYAEKEATAVGGLIKDSKVFLRKQATKEEVKKFGANAQVIHFASHGIFKPEKPLESGLALARYGSSDGMLTVGELYEMQLGADLVTLSACETGLGKIESGDDVVGITRGFLYAGAGAIISTLWQVDDEATGMLMRTFYDQLRKNDARTALRNAQMTLKNGSKRAPYYWAAFQITGNAASISLMAANDAGLPKGAKKKP